MASVLAKRISSMVSALDALDFVRKTDAQLLSDYLASRDERAFAALVRRHGTMVLGVCRRILGNADDAEDAFQATFIVLLRRAPSLASHPSVGAWLHGVARRTALKARARAARRRTKELTDAAVVASPNGERNDWLPFLDEELCGLPEKYRLPIVLCDLEGKTRREAAQQLAWPEGTVAWRLSQGRAMLGRRLLRRVQKLCLLGGALTSATARGALPAGLVALTLRAAGLGPLGQATSIAAASSAHCLARSVLRAYFFRKLTTIGAAGLICLVCMAAGIGGFTQSAVPANLERPPLAAEENAERAPGPKSDAAASDDANLVNLQLGEEDGDNAKIKNAIQKAAKYLRAAQTKGNWEKIPSHVGGYSALAVCALLAAGEKADDPAVAKGLEYLRGIEPVSTYVTSLQTVAFCQAGMKQDEERIKRNVKWLLEAMARDGEGRCLGWSYTRDPGTRGDNSNTQYAVMALHVAEEKGIAVDAKFWRKLKEYYLRTQGDDGGWRYASDTLVQNGSSMSMTCAGIAGLAICRLHLKEDPAPATEKGWQLVGRFYERAPTPFPLYTLHSLGRAGTLSGKAKLPPRDGAPPADWYKVGAAKLLPTQMADGRWQSDSSFEADPIIATSYAILFLASKK